MSEIDNYRKGKLFGGQGPLAYPVSQVCFTISEANMEAVREEVLRWIARRAGRPLPQKAWRGDAFQLEEVGAQRTEVCRLISPYIWAGRLDDADRVIASRTWVTEVVFAQRDDGSVVFGARLTAVVRSETSFDRSVPVFVRQIASRNNAFLDGIKLADTPWLIANEESVRRLVALLLDKHRFVDVIVIATAENSSDVGTVIIDAFDVAKRLTAAAHVAIITSEASFMLSDILGKEFSVFRQAVRTYKPGFSPDHDEPFVHPLGLPHKISQWADGGAAGYTKLIVSNALKRTVSNSDIENQVPSFAAVKRTAAEVRFEAAKNAGSSDADLLHLYEQDNQELRKQVLHQKETSDALLVISEEEKTLALDTARQAHETIKHLQHRIKSLLSASTQDAKIEARYPDDLSDIEEWCALNLAGAVELHGRAYRGLKASQYENPSLVYEALLLLRDYYVPMRREGGGDLVQSFERKCSQLGLDEEATGSESRAAEEGDEYYVSYAGRKRYMVRHLKKGNSREPRYCFRVYFFWDEESEQVIVGWMPSHLDSRVT